MYTWQLLPHSCYDSAHAYLTPDQHGQKNMLWTALQQFLDNGVYSGEVSRRAQQSWPHRLECGTVLLETHRRCVADLRKDSAPRCRCLLASAAACRWAAWLVFAASRTARCNRCVAVLRPAGQPDATAQPVTVLSRGGPQLARSTPNPSCGAALPASCCQPSHRVIIIIVPSRDPLIGCDRRSVGRRCRGALPHAPGVQRPCGLHPV